MTEDERKRKRVVAAFSRWAECSSTSVWVRKLGRSYGRYVYLAGDGATCAKMAYDASGPRLKQLPDLTPF